MSRRVLHLSPSPLTPSGISRYGQRFAAVLRDAGAEVQTIETGTPITSVRDYARLAANVAGAVDLVHVELGGGTLAEFVAVQALMRTSATPIFLTLHDPPGVVWAAYPPKLAALGRPVRGALSVAWGPRTAGREATMLARAHGIFVLTQLGSERLRAVHRRLELPEVHVLPFPVARLERTSDAPTDTFVLGYHGYWYGAKGLPTLVQALQLLGPSRRPVVARLWGDVLPSAGASASRYRRRVIRALPSGRRGIDIEVPGFLSEERIGQELSTCDVIVLPYTSPVRKGSIASTSAALWDALAAGVPVIASDTRALAEHVRHEVDGLLVPPGDAHALAAALERVRDDADLLARLRQGAERVRVGLDPSRAGTLAMETYARVLRQPRR